jgi:zinc protease
MTRRLCAGVLLLLLSAAALSQPLQKTHSIEGVTEHRLQNGLRVLTLPDPGIDTITVHIMYMVGSRHEGYGEKGMAHLLEHLLFKGSPRHPDIKDELTRRGARWNGTTSSDRTNYFETFGASDDNLDWALSLEADRMVNARVSRQDLDSEMTVVRNEFESGENSPGAVLFQRMQQLAFPWHNYGNAIIGNRSDIESVPIDRLQAFYRTWYQPDNALLIVAGRFDEKRALELVAKHFGTIPRPSRSLPALYTRDPTQDGERNVTLRRAGDNQLVMALYRAPAGSHADYPALDVLVQTLGDAPSGRLHRMLVQKGLSSSAWASERALHDPGFLSFGATLDKSAPLAPAREALLEAIEGAARSPEGLQAAEVERARTRLLNDFEKTQLETASLVRALSEFQAIGDWRLYFLYRERLRKVTLADVQRVAAQYLRPANRVLGEFVPTEAPQRAEIPEVTGLQETLSAFRPADESVRLGETFDPSPKNIEARVVRKQLANGIRAAFLPKKTRGGRVVASLTLHWGDEKSLTNREAACSFAGSMLTRGTRKRSRAELQDAFDKLNASVSIGGDGASVEVRRENLAAALRLAAEALREPAFPQSEFDEMKRAALTGAEAQRGDPGALAGVRLSRHLQAYPEGHPHYTPTVDERIGWMRKATLKDAVACYRELFGATGADFVVVGEFDPDEMAKLAEELFGGWKTPRPFARVPARYFERPRLGDDLLTPDKANAVLRGGLNLKMRDDHPDFPAMVLANHLLGGSSVARVPARVREKEGLSYSTFTSFTSSAFDESATFRVSAIYAPQNRARVEGAIREELSRAVRDGFAAGEVDAAKKSLLEARRLSRTQDRALAGRLGSYLFAKRTFEWDIEFESRIAALTPEAVHAVLKRHIDPERLSVVTAGAFREEEAKK